MRVANCQALLSKHTFIHFSEISKFADRLPEEYKEQFLAIVLERHLTTSIQADDADGALCSIATAISMGYFSWLQASGIPKELQNTIKEFPIVGSKLFSSKKQRVLCTL